MKRNILMVGVDETSHGGMLTIANYYRENEKFNEEVNLYYVATATKRKKIIKILFFIKQLFKVGYYFLLKKIDIVHIHMAEKTSVNRKYIIMSLAKLFNCKIIVQLHAGPFIDWYETLKESKKKFVRKVLNTPDKLLVLGNYWIKEMRLIVDEDRMEVLYNGIKIEKRKYNIEAKNILFCAYLRKNKGIYDLLKAIELVRNDLPSDTIVDLCGISDEFDIQEYLDSHNLKDIIQFHGWLNEEELEKVKGNAAISVLPTYYEGLSMSILESMAYGIPVLTTNVTTMPELLGEIVDMVNPGDYHLLSELILDLIYDVSKREKISQMEYDRVKELFSIDAMISKTLSLYQEL